MLTDSIDLTLRAVKGSDLTWDEADTNFVRLREAILGITAALNVSRVVLGAEPALGDRPGVAWIPTDLSGVFVWSGSAWVRVKEPAMYGTATGVANAYTCTITVPVNETPTLASLTGRTIKLKISGANTGASTLALNGLAATAIKKFGATDLVAGDLANGSVAIVVYDGTYYQLVSATPLAAMTVADIYGALPSPLSAGCPAAGTSAALPHTLGRMPIILSAVLTCVTPTGGHSAGDEVSIHSTASTDTNGGWPLFSVTADASNVYVALTDSVEADWVLCKDGNGRTPFVASAWHVKVYIL